MQPTADTRPPLFFLLTGALIAFVLILANRFVGLLLPLPDPMRIADLPALHGIAICYLGALLAALLITARAAARLPQSTGFLLVVGAIFALPYFLLQVGTAAFLKSGNPLHDLSLAFTDVLPPLIRLAANNLFAPLGMALLGAGIGRILKHPNTLLAGAGFAIFFDIVVVTMGTVAQFLKNNPNVIAAVSIGGDIPSAASKTHLILSGVTIGPADVLFLAFFLAAVHHLRLSGRATEHWLFGLLFGALALVEISGLPVPALAPMGVAVLIANLRHAAFTREEKFALIYGGGFALILAVLMVLGARGLIGG